MTSAPAKIFDSDGMEQVMQTFDDTKAWNLPVVDEEGRYQGFVSKSKIFNSYRQVLVHFQKTNHPPSDKAPGPGFYVDKSD